MHIDASRVEFIDATGIGTLAEIAQMAKVEGATFELIGRSPSLQHALDSVDLGTTRP